MQGSESSQGLFYSPVKVRLDMQPAVTLTAEDNTHLTLRNGRTGWQDAQTSAVAHCTASISCTKINWLEMERALRKTTNKHQALDMSCTVTPFVYHRSLMHSALSPLHRRIVRKMTAQPRPVAQMMSMTNSGLAYLCPLSGRTVPPSAVPSPPI